MELFLGGFMGGREKNGIGFGLEFLSSEIIKIA